ncbi:MAG: DUF1569 domain-containing protein [Bacteroidia bacterium]|nr:DUF1569 domain-containing protein [Bacteroidia bacterium]
MKKSVFSTEVQTEILSRLEKLSETTLPLWGEMTPAQMLKHLQLAFKISTGQIKVSDRSTFFTRNFLRHFLLSAKVPSLKRIEKNPPMTFPEIDVQLNTTVKESSFSTEKENFIAAFHLLPGIELFVETHPLIGKMKREDWGNHFYSHINYHFTQFGI